MPNSGVYQIRNIANGKRYVGSSRALSSRASAHFRKLAAGKHHSLPLQRAWAKYGADSFEFQTMLYCAEDDLLMYEQIVIDGLRPEYNVAINATSPMKGRRLSAESRAAISNALRGRALSDAHRIQISQRMRGNKNALGSRLSDSAKALVSAARKGKLLSQEHREKLSLAKAGKPGLPRSMEARRKISEAAKVRWAVRKAGCAHDA